jgi:hypothetical protein
MSKVKKRHHCLAGDGRLASGQQPSHPLMALPLLS